MIRINLVQQRRVKRDADGQRVALMGVGIIAAAAAAVFLLVHMPLADDIEKQLAKNAELDKEIKELRKETKNFKKIEDQYNAALDQAQAIKALEDARAVPAWLLKEISTILTRDGQPTMTDQMARRVRMDANRAWMDGWDPKHVWITNFSEKGGRFKMTGGAQSDADMTQLALRLQASNYFVQVVPEGGGQAKNRGVNFFKFTITGRVRY